jgi:hypothetical protein
MPGIDWPKCKPGMGCAEARIVGNAEASKLTIEAYRAGWELPRV